MAVYNETFNWTQTFYFKGYGFLLFAKKWAKSSLKTASKRDIQEKAKATGGLVGLEIRLKKGYKGHYKESKKWPHQ